MKVVVWGINYAPERTGIAPYNTGLCNHLAGAGHEVRMLTTFSYYPEWRKAPGDRGRLYRTDRVDGVAVHRCWHFVPPRPTALKRMIHEATFVATSWLRLLVLPRPDVVVVVSPPLLLGLAAWIACTLKRCRYVFHVQDMQPDAAVRLGMLRPGKLTRVLYAFERLAYRHAAVVSGITPGMLRMFSQKGVPAARQVLFPNWTHGSASSGAAGREGAFRTRHGIASSTFLAVYSGNLGRKQGLDIILDVARPLVAEGARFCFVIAGDGVEKAALEARVSREGLANVRLLPLQSADGYAGLLADADVCLVTQQTGSGALFFPSKLLTILEHGRPVIAVADRGGELEHAVASGQFGWSVAPGDMAGLEAVLRAAADSAGELGRRATAGREWVHQFEAQRVLSAFEAELRERVAGKILRQRRMERDQ